MMELTQTARDLPLRAAGSLLGIRNSGLQASSYGASSLSYVYDLVLVLLVAQYPAAVKEYWECYEYS